MSIFTVHYVHDDRAFLFTFLQLEATVEVKTYTFVLGAGQGAERYFKVSTESDAVLGDSKWFQ